MQITIEAKTAFQECLLFICLSKSMTLCCSEELTFFVTSSSDSRSVNLSFNLCTSSRILVLGCILF